MYKITAKFQVSSSKTVSKFSSKTVGRDRFLVSNFKVDFHFFLLFLIEGNASFQELFTE